MESSQGLRKFSEQLSKNKPRQALDGSPVLSRNYDKTPISELIKSNKADLSYAVNSNQLLKSYDYLKPKVFEQNYTNQDYSPITNLNSKRSYKSNGQNNVEQQTNMAVPEDKSKKEGCILRRQENYYYAHQTEFGVAQTFQDYKMKKNKSVNQINRNLPQPPQRQTIYADYKENRAQIRMNYNSKPAENFLKIDYAKVEGGRCNRKFNYLSESNQ